MSKRLRSCLQSSADEFLDSATKLNFKTSKPTLKNLINSIKPSSDLSSSLPLSLQQSISKSIVSFQKILDDPASPPSPRGLPMSKRTHRTSGNSPAEPETVVRKEQVLDTLRVLSHIVSLCVSHPKSVFSLSDLLASVQALHNNLIIFDSDQVLSNEVTGLCEGWWKEGFPGRETLISQSLPYLLSRSLLLKKKVDLHRVYSLREAFTLFDFEDESIQDLKMLLMRCVVSPLYVKSEDGRRFVAFAFGLSRQLLKEALAVVKAQIPFGRKSALEGYGEILLKAWRGLDDDLKGEIEDFLQGLMEAAILARSSPLAASVRRIFGGFIQQRTTEGVEKILFRIAEPVIFRSLQVANSDVRQNALHMLLDLFPLEDPDSTKEAKDTLLEKQFFLLERLMMDDCPDIRVIAVEGCCRVLNLFWEVIPAPTITKIITKIFNDMSCDNCNEVRLSTINGIIYLLGNPQSHDILKVLLPRLGQLMLNGVMSIRVAVADLLLLVRDIRNFQFSKVVPLDVLLSILANDMSQVAQKITKLLMPSYFPSRITTEEACNRCVTLLKRSPMAGARFCEYAVSEGASRKSILELVKVLVRLVLSSNNLNANQIEGLLVATAHLCKDLVSEVGFGSSLQEVFTKENIKLLFSAASTARSRSSVYNIVSTISPDDLDGLLETCMSIVINCSGLPEDVDRQAEVRAVHKLLISSGAFDDMLEALTKLLQKTAYRCHVKFGSQIQKSCVSSAKRKKHKSSREVSAKWKHVSGKRTSSFEEDFAISVGIAWQLKELLMAEDTRQVILESQSIEIFHALMVISEASFVQSTQCEYMDVYPVMAFTALALHMAFQTVNSTDDSAPHENDTSSSPNKTSTMVLDTAIDHLLTCSYKLLEANDSATPGEGNSNSNYHQSKSKKRSGQKHREVQTSTCNSVDSGSVHGTQLWLLKKVKMLSAVLLFVVDSVVLGSIPHVNGKCLEFSSAFVQCAVATIKQQSSDKIQLKGNYMDYFLCLKSSFTYAAKLLNVTLENTNEASPPPNETFCLANNMLDLIATVEQCLGSNTAARLVTAVNPWLPDLILALGSFCIQANNKADTTYCMAYDQLKLHFPSWSLTLAKTELHEISKVNEQEEVEQVSDRDELPIFRKLMGVIFTLLNVNPKILDALGVVFLTASAIGLERKDFGLVYGLLHFLCVKMIGQEDSQWSKFDIMLDSLPQIYPLIEKEIGELIDDDNDDKKTLLAAKELLEPVWMYHVYETHRFSMRQE